MQLGSFHHGVHELRRRAAWLGATVEPDGKGMERDYGDVGGSVLWQMREVQVARNALRVGCDGRDALVCLDTAAYPNWLPVKNPDTPGDISLWGTTEQRVRELFVNEERDGSTTAEITDALSDVHERTVRRACRRHADRGLLKVRSDPEDGRRIRWEDHGLGTLRRDACAEVELPELENDGGTVADKPRMRLYTRNVRNLPEVENSPSLSPLSDAPVSATGTLDPPDPVE